MRTAGRLGAGLVAWLAACTAGPGPVPGPTFTPSPPAPGAAPVRVPVVASVTGPTSETDGGYVDGMRAAERVVNRFGGIDGRPLSLDVIDDGGEPSEAEAALRAAVAEGPAAVVVGAGEAITAVRVHIERHRTPVMLVGADLYSSRELFRQVFQTAPPLRWQADVLARYLVADRGTRRILVVTGGEPAPADVVAEALADQGVTPFSVRTVIEGLRGPAGRADAVVIVAGPGDSARAARVVAGLGDPPRIVLTGAGLERTFAEGAGLPPGTGAVAAYTWAGWAEPVPRVARFRSSFQRRFGRLPGGFEQEGFEAVRTLAYGLSQTGGRGGDALLRALEGFPGGHFASVPIDLGPDDHLLADRHLLGMFAVAGPGEDVEPFTPTWAPWRPVMRTFTLLLGERTSILDRDKRHFFPGWTRRQPAPLYTESRYGIVTGTGDPLH